MFLFSVLCATFIVNMILTIIEERKQAKRNESRELRDIEYHEKRMKDYK
jgi:hypothetical protein